MHLRVQLKKNEEKNAVYKTFFKDVDVNGLPVVIDTILDEWCIDKLLILGLF